MADDNNVPVTETGRAMNVGFYHESAGHRRSGGIAVFMREMAVALSESNDVFLYTTECNQVDALARSQVEVLEVPLPTYNSKLQGAIQRTTPLNGQNAEKLLMFYGAVRGGYLRHIERNVDVLLTSQWLDDILLSNAVRTPTVYEEHGFNNPGIAVDARKRLSSTQHLLANSQQTADDIRAELGVTVDAVVYPGVDVQRYRSDVPPAFESEQPVVLFVGRLTKDNGIFDLVEAFETVADRAHLYFVGRGDFAPIESRSRALGIEEAVQYEGIVSEADLPGYYAACDVFCLPSHYEGLGMVNLEAMACERPVVTTEVGGIPEYATHGKNALLSSPGDTEMIRNNIQNLISSPVLRAEIGARGREVAEAFSWQRQAERLASVCESVIEHGGSIETTPATQKRST